jgi:hypothetical protein
MDITRRSATLTLRTADAVVNTNKTEMTWHNINLRVLLNGMFDEFENFILVADTFATNFLASSNLNDLSVYSTVEGLPWMNQGYIAGGQVTQEATLFPIVFSTAVETIYHGLQVPLVFSKNQNTATITIRYKTILGGAITNATPFPDAIFVFKVYGLPR